MATITWTIESLDRLREIYNFIADDSPRSAVNVINGIYDKAQLLQTFPLLGQRYERITDRHVREIIYGNYRIAYLIVNDTDILILGVFHAAMDIDSLLR
ncbi:MAG: type II toxin-antitoxin system RelE/ParE family toxin [Pirellulales bacterium]